MDLDESAAAGKPDDSGSQSREPSLKECLTNANWLKNSGAFTLAYAPKCFLPAGLFLGMIVIAFGSLFISSRLIFVGGNVGLPQLVGALVITLCAGVGAMTCAFFSLSLWLVRLTAFAHAFNALPTTSLLADSFDKSAARDLQKRSLDIIGKKGAFLAKFWSLMTIFLVPPFIALMASGTLSMICSPAFSEDMRAHPSASTFSSTPAILDLLTWGATHPVIGFVSKAFMVIFFVYTTAVSLLGMVISATKEGSASEAANSCIALSFRQFVPVMLLTAGLTLLNLLFTSPREITNLFNSAATMSDDVMMTCVEEVWRSISSVIVWPFTLVPIVAFLKQVKR